LIDLDLSHKITKSKGKLYIFCAIRAKKILLTPEEYVRQSFIDFLLKEVGLSKNRIVLEFNLSNTNVLTRRADLVAFDKELNINLLVEFKSNQIGLTESMITQVLDYSRILKPKFICLTNGLEFKCLILEREEYQNISFVEMIEFLKK